MDQYQEKNFYARGAIAPGALNGIGNPGVPQAERAQTATDVMLSRAQSNNNGLQNLENWVQMILNRIGHHQEPNQTPPCAAPTPSRGGFHDLALTIEETTNLSERLHKLVAALETYV